MSFLADRSAVSIGLGGIPSLRSGTGGLNPSLDLDFAVSKSLDPRITFTRASEARYYDASTQAVAEQNLLTYSQQFDNAAWLVAVGTATKTANTTTAPDGTLTADEIAATSTNATIWQTYTPVVGSPYSGSIYLKRKTGTGTVELTVNGSTYSSVDLSGGGWVRATSTYTATSGTKAIGIRIATSGDEVYVWGAQLEQRSTVTAYTPTTTAAVTNYIPVLQVAASGVARFDHNPVTRESLGLLIEEQRTNLLTYSEQFDNAAWTKSNATVTANAVIAPDGTLTGDKLIEDSTNTVHRVSQQPLSTVTGSTYTLTVYAKKAERNWIILRDVSRGLSAWANLDTGTVGTVQSGLSLSVSPVGNGWYRCVLVRTAQDNSVLWGIHVATGDNVITYTGDGYSGIYIWGAQLEAGAFATSYIPTVASQVTRSADAASMTGANFSSWYRADEGTLYGEYTGSAGWALQFGVANNFNDRIALGTTSGNNFVVSDSSGVNQATLGTYNGTQQTFAKVSGAYRVNDFACSVNGGVVATDTSGTVPNPIAANIGSRNSGTPAGFLNGTIKKIAYYPVRLANATLQSLTA